VQQRRLARAGRPDQADDLARIDVDVDAAQHGQIARLGLVDALDAAQGQDRIYS
jgi:hypothetical protein